MKKVSRESVHGQQEKTSDRMEASVAPMSFDLFGGQPQMNHHQQESMLHALQRQQSGLNDMQQMQQQFIFRKMQESQMQQQQQLDLRSQGLVNQGPRFSKQTPGSQSSSLVNGTSNSDSLQYPYVAEPGTNWLNRGSSVVQGSPSGLGFPPNLAQTHQLMELVPQQADQSLYGVPVSSSRGLSVNKYPQMVTDRSSMPRASTFRNSIHGGQQNFLADQGDRQESTPISRPKIQNENIGHVSGQSLNTGMADMSPLQQMNLMQRNAAQKHFTGRQELATQPETLNKKSTWQVSSSPDEATLDPDEKKILFGSDDNLWSGFAESSNVSGEASNLFDNGGLSNGFPSLQSGSWSALMQSAVAETSSSDIAPQEEWSGLNLYNDGSSANQHTLMHNDYVEKTSLLDDGVRIPSATNSGSIRSCEEINVMGSNQTGHKFQNKPVIGVSTDSSQRFRQSLDESSKWSNRSLLQNSVAERSQKYGNAMDSERTAEKVSGTWVPGSTGGKLERNGWNAMAAVPPGGDGVSFNHEPELSQKSPNNRSMVMEGGAHGSSLWKSNSVTGSANEFVNDASASVAKSRNTGVGNGTSPFSQNNNLLHQWKSAYPPANSLDSEDWGGMRDQVNEHNQGLDSSNRGGKYERRHDVEICTMKENSNDSHHSNISQHASGGVIEVGLSDSSDSRYPPPGKQKITNQLAHKVPVPHKFQYHPLGNLAEDVEPTFGMKQHTLAQASSLQNTQPGQLSQVSRYSALKDKAEFSKDNKGTNEEPSFGIFPPRAPRMHFPYNRPLDSYASNKASSPSQNMLELLHKVDQSGNDGAVMRSSSDYNISSQLPDAETSDGSAGHTPRGQSFISKGFGLQLGPPSQRLRNPDPSLSSQNARDAANSGHTSHADAEMGEKILQTSSARSFLFPTEGSQYENHGSSGSGLRADQKSLYKAPSNYHLAHGSDTLYARNQLQNKKITGGSEKMTLNEQDPSFSGNTSHSMQRGFAEALPDGASHNILKDNIASYEGMPGTSDIHGRGPATAGSTRGQILSSQHFGAPSISRQGGSARFLQNMGNNVSPHLSVQPHPNIVESSTHGDLHVNKGGRFSSELNAIHVSAQVVDAEEHKLENSSGPVSSFVNMDSTSIVEESLVKASSIKDNLEDSPASSTSTQKDIEAFGRSLKPNAFSNKNYQMKALNDAQSDPSSRASKRIKGIDNISDVSHVHLKAGQLNEDSIGDTLNSSAVVPSDDSRMFNLSSSSDIMQRNTFMHKNIASRDIMVAGLGASQNNSSDFTTSVRNHQVAPQMEPYWLNQYGSFKNGKMMHAYDAQKVTPLRPDEPPSSLVKSSGILDVPNLENNTTALVGSCQVGGNLDSSPTSISHEQLSSVQSLQIDLTGQHQAFSRLEKRKRDTTDCHPWHKEISGGSRNILVLSAAQADWSKAANCLSEKVQDDADLIEDGPPLLRSRRRLILTTQLMQQLFRPPLRTILSSDDSSMIESVTYAVSRVALGDACSAVACSSDLAHRHCLDLHSMKGKLNGDPHFAKVITELLGKSRKLEDDFLRLDKSASILDLRLECQELEKFSVINRFAKFHGRGVSEAPSPYGTAQNTLVQRIATVVSVPKNFPDRVQCLSL